MSAANAVHLLWAQSSDYSIAQALEIGPQAPEMLQRNEVRSLNILLMSGRGCPSL